MPLYPCGRQGDTRTAGAIPGSTTPRGKSRVNRFTRGEPIGEPTGGLTDPLTGGLGWADDSGSGVEELVAEGVGHLFDLPVPGAELVQALCHGLGGDPVRR